MMNRIMKSMFVCRRLLSQCSGNSAYSVRSFASSKSSGDQDPRITLTDDGSTIVCWHPQKSAFPYEHSLPYVEEDDRSVFKAESVAKGENIYYKGKVTLSSMEEVQAFTYTSKHVWNRKRTDGLQLRPDHPRKGV